MGPDGRGQMLIFFPAMRHKTSGIAHIPCPEGWAGMIVDHININLMKPPSVHSLGFQRKQAWDVS